MQIIKVKHGSTLKFTRDCPFFIYVRIVQKNFLNEVCNYNLGGSGTLLMLHNFNQEWCHKLFSFLAATLWNSLPTYVRSAKDILTLIITMTKFSNLIGYQLS